MVPIAASVWSSDPKQVYEFPAKTLIRFMHNHCLLQIFSRPTWRTVTGGSKNYAEKIASKIQNINLNSKVTSVKRLPSGKVEVLAEGKRPEIYDAVVIGTHADYALQILSDPTKEEKEILSKFTYRPCIAYLHSDETLMPRIRKVWASWNFLAPQNTVTYWMNRLQNFIPKDLLLFVSVNPPYKPKNVLYEVAYDHPQYTTECVKAQSELHQIQGNGIYFCGSYFRFGFHEDAFTSGLLAAELLGVKAPWKVEKHDRSLDMVKNPPLLTFTVVVNLLLFLLSLLVALILAVKLY